jgi:aminoglycoside/choline kinase family phosphotransferase
LASKPLSPTGAAELRLDYANRLCLEVQTAKRVRGTTLQPNEPSISVADIERWLDRMGHPPSRLEPLAGDVSARRYLRVESGGRNLIVAVYPAELRTTCERFLITGKLLRDAGLRVPAVLASDCRMGAMLLEDLGEQTLYDRRNEPWLELRPYLEQAIDDAGRIARLQPASVAGLCPPLDQTLLERELEQTWRSFLSPRGLSGDRQSTAALGAALTELCHQLGEEPQVPCHRDYMARNLVPLPEGRLGLLDHQDLRLGPPFYDLASLFNDSLFPPAQLTSKLLGAAADELGYRRAAAQRTLKAVGTFATFAERGHPRHLGLIPPTLGRAIEHLLLIPETADITQRLADRWRAVC